MTNLQIMSLIGLILYFGLLLFAVTKEKKNTNVLDYFFAGRSLPFWALSITFIASWWGAGSAISAADLAYEDGLGAFWYYGVPVLISTFLMIIGAAVLTGTLIVLIYSMFGGFRGVVLTDIIQFVLPLASAVCVFVVAMMNSGGFSQIVKGAEGGGKSDYMSMGAGALKYLGYVITFGCAWMIQANVRQRISATRSDRDARKMTVMSFLPIFPFI